MAWLTVDKDGTENIFNNERNPFIIKELGNGLNMIGVIIARKN